MKILYFFFTIICFLSLVACKQTKTNSTNEFEEILFPQTKGLLLGIGFWKNPRWSIIKTRISKKMKISESKFLFFAKKNWNGNNKDHIIVSFAVENDFVKAIELDCAATANKRKYIMASRTKMYSRIKKSYGIPDADSKTESVWIRNNITIRLSKHYYIKEMDQQYFTMKIVLK